MGAAERTAVIAGMRAVQPEVQARMLAAVRDSVPAYRSLSSDQAGDVSAIASWALTRIVDGWLTGAALDERDLARFRGIGATRAEDGRPLPAVLRAYRVATVAAIDAVVDLGGSALDRDDVLALTRVVLTAIDQLSEEIIAGWTAARDRLTDDRDRSLSGLLDDLVIGRQSSPGAFAARSRELGLALPERAVLAVLEATDPTTHISAAALVALPPDLAPPERHLAAVRGGRAVLLLPADVGPLLTGVVQARAWRGCAVPATGSSAVAAAHRLAADALDTAPPHAFTDRPVLDEGDAQLLALLAARSGADPSRVADTVLGPLVEAANRHLLDGLSAYLVTGNATDAARALHIHPQTLRYRLRRARYLTGRDPQLPWHRLALDVARHAAAGQQTPARARLR